MSRAGSGRTSLYFSYSAAMLGRGRLGHFPEELLDGNLDQLGRDALVLVAIRLEDVVGSDQRRAQDSPDIGQPNLVGDVGQELVAADPIIEAAQEDLEQVAVHLVAGDLLEIFLTHLGARRQTKPVGFLLEDQGVDNVSVLGRAERMRAKIRIQLGPRTCWRGSAARAFR